MQTLLNLTDHAPAAALILGLMVAASLLTLSLAPTVLERHLFRPYWLLRRREFHTLFTSGFLHADLAHLFFNAFTFWAFAFSLERAMGTPRFVALYLVGLLVSDAGTWLKQRLNPDYRTLGASGAILAVLFASIVYTPSQAIYILPIPVPIPAPLFALAYLAYTVWAARQGQGRVNHDAHLGGALAGIAFVAVTDAQALGQAWRHFLG
ncbi:MAG: rhomboid family intramembrane serine protease [Pseudomonadota bacterium]